MLIQLTADTTTITLSSALSYDAVSEGRLLQCQAYAEASEEWAVSPDPISTESGGDELNDRSSKYWAEQSAASAAGVSDFADEAEAWANHPENTAIPINLGGDGSTTFSSFHWAQKSEDSATAASGFASTAEGHATTATNKAGEASGFASTASGHATTATNKAGEANQSAIDAEQSHQDAHAAQSAAETAQGLAEDAKAYAQEWANSNTWVSVPAGGDGSTTKSAKTLASEAAQSALDASGYASSAATAETHAHDWAEHDLGQEIPGHGGSYSAMHWANQSSLSATAADGSADAALASEQAAAVSAASVANLQGMTKHLAAISLGGF